MARVISGPLFFNVVDCGNDIFVFATGKESGSASRAEFAADMSRAQLEKLRDVISLVLEAERLGIADL